MQMTSCYVIFTTIRLSLIISNHSAVTRKAVYNTNKLLYYLAVKMHLVHKPDKSNNHS